MSTAPFDRGVWAEIEATVPRAWSRAAVLPDPVDVRLDAVLEAAGRAVDLAAGGPGVVDLIQDQERPARMLQTYAVRAATRAVRNADPRLVHRAALALIVAVPAADYRDQVRVIAVVADAAKRVDTSLREVTTILQASWDEVHLHRFVEFDARPRWERGLRAMEYHAQGEGPDFRYVDRMAGDPAESARELADLMQTAGFPADVVAQMRADAGPAE